MESKESLESKGVGKKSRRSNLKPMSKFCNEKTLKSAGTEFVFRKVLNDWVILDFAIRFLYELRKFYSVGELNCLMSN